MAFAQTQSGNQALVIKNRGLFTAPNQLGVPEGALVQADNVNIDEQDLLESRRGLERLLSYSDGSFHASRYYSYQSTLISAYGPTSATWGGNLAYYNGSLWVPYTGSFLHPDPVMARLRFMEAQSNLYLTTSAGVYKLDAFDATPSPAGMYGALDLTGTITGTSGFLTSNAAVTITATTTNLSATLTALSATTGISVGQYCSGTGIPTGTTVTAVTAAGTVLVTAGNTTAGVTTYAALQSINALAVGQLVVASNIPTGTTITAITAASTAATTNTAFTGNSTTATPSAMTSIAVGQLVNNANVPANTYVTAVLATTIIMSNAATTTAAASSTLYQTPQSVTMSNSAVSTATAQVVTFETAPTVTLSAAATVSNTGVSLSFSTGSQVAYRVVWGIEDANLNQIVGSPSNRAVVVNNSGTTCNVSLAVTIPSGITTNHYYQLYRTAMSDSANVDPGDEPQLVYESNPSPTDISNGTLTIVDIVPDSLRGASLYTNASQQGASQANNPPPLCTDMVLFRDFTFYANTTSKQIRSLTLISVGSPGGLQSGDILTLAGVAYTGDSTETASTGHFKVDTSGTPAQNIANTALSLVRVINQYASNTTVYASYLSGVNDLPGMISISERGIGGSKFYALASAHGSAFNPTLPTSGTTVASTNNNNLNGLMYSKAGQAEAVPLTNIYYVGSASNRILRILPLRDSLFILKEREGIYQLTGYDPSSFIITLFDSSTRLLAPDSAVVLNNQIYALTDQGITTISETGSGVQSRPIEDQILAVLGSSLTSVKTLTTGISYETDRKYLLSAVTGASDVVPTQCFVFNTFTQAFTRWKKSMTTGFVNPVDNKLYAGDGLSSYSLVERKTYSLTDYADEGLDYSISSFSGTLVYMPSTGGISPGDRLYQSSSVNSLITAVQTAYVTVADTLTNWTAAACTVFKAIDCEVEYAPVTFGNPGQMKQIPEMSLLFKQNQFNTATLSLASDVSPYFESVTLDGNNSGLWGLFPWGTVPWGGVSSPEPTRALIPREKQWCSQLRVKFQHKNAWGIFKLEGLSIPETGSGTWTVGK